ncbi:MAG: sulfatase [Planctomycetota bacterium]|nr:sulfatase [Planctomycetota bacterium]MDA1249979.1 sulfatase [Planctomycetota bacterium]
MSRRPRLWLAVLFLMSAVVTNTAPADPSEPARSEKLNVVFLLADDLGWTGLRCFGSDFYETPNLDRLAARSTRFTNAYAACTVCSPTRASIMTGMYPARLHLTDFIAGQNRPFAKLSIPDWTKFLEHRHVTIAEALQQAGYRTGMIGKWHLDQRGARANEFAPVRHGYDEQHFKPPGTRGYFIPEKFKPLGESGSRYATDYLTDQAVDFIERSKDKPFFLYFAYHTPHTPIEGREDLVAEFRAKVREDATHKNPVYAAMVKSLDMSVGRVLQQLEKSGVADRTLVVFTSDNGGLTQRYGKHDGFTENLPLRRGKGSAYEGGVRVPTIVYLPGVSKPGSDCDEPVCTIDWYPTLLELTGSKGDSTHNSSVDGASIAGLIRDPQARLERNLYWHYPHYHAGGDGPYSAVRSGDWRLIEFHEDRHLELYNLRQDLGERQNLAASHPKEASTLLADLRSWRKRVGAQMPTPNPDFDAKKATEVERN